MKAFFLHIVFLVIFMQLSAQKVDNDTLNVSFNFPAKGKLASLYGWRTQKNKVGIKERKFHKGVDIAGKWGEKIYATAAGKISFVGRNNGYGLFIEIKHNDRYSSGYGHLRKVYVKKGEFVSEGQIIGEMGNSGTTFSTIGGKGIHLHFEIRDNSKKTWYSPKGAVNPLKQIGNSKKFRKYDHVCYQPTPEFMESYHPVFIPTNPDSRNNVAKSDNNVLLMPVRMSLKKEVIIPLGININTKLENRLIKPNNVFAKRTVPDNTINYAIQIEAHDVQLSQKEINILEKKYEIKGIRWGKVNINGKTWFKYTIGCFENMEEARNYQRQLISQKKIKASAICIFESGEIIKTLW